jgi:hypothetical protein
MLPDALIGTPIFQLGDGGGGLGGGGEGGGGGGGSAGVVHIVAGNGGAPLSLNPTFPPSSIWQRLRYDWGYLRLDATARRLHVESVTPSGEVVDAFVLRR